MTPESLVIMPLKSQRGELVAWIGKSVSLMPCLVSQGEACCAEHAGEPGPEP
jgi:hypothetical protein